LILISKAKKRLEGVEDEHPRFGLSTLSFNVENGSAAFFCWFTSSSSLSMLTFRTASVQAHTLLVLFFQ